MGGQAMRPRTHLNAVHSPLLHAMLTEHFEEGLWWKNVLKRQLRLRT